MDEALTFAHRTSEHHYEAELHRLKGELLLRQGAVGVSAGSAGADDAAACFHRALDIARSEDAKSLELRAASSLSESRAPRGTAELTCSVSRRSSTSCCGRAGCRPSGKTPPPRWPTCLAPI